jgi:predicted ATPase
MHTFKNFKNFEYAEIDLSKPMTLLIGRNGSGKSNVIEGVELLAQLIKGRELYEILDVERGGEFEIRGGLHGCFRQGFESFELGVKERSIRYRKEEFNCLYKINSKPTITQTSTDNIYAIAKENYDSECAAANYQRDHYEKQYHDFGFIDIEDFIRDYQDRVLEKCGKVYAYDIYPRLMRQYFPIGLAILNRKGSNISSVLYYLKQNNPEILENILNRIKQLPEEEFVSFEFITTSDNSDVLFALKYPNGEIISAKLLSDGTLRALAILTALETVPEGSRIIIEEIDNGVHASRVHILIEAIWEASNRRHLNILITTHNPTTLDSLNDEQLECVVVCHYDKPSQSAKLTPFFELPRVYELLERGHLGSLVVRNIIEQYLDPKFEQEQQQIMDEWLESLA